MSEIENVREILRALAEVRDGVFYPLYVKLPRPTQHPWPKIGFRIYKVSDSAEATLSVWVSAFRPDMTEVSCSVRLETVEGSLIVSASVDIDDDELFVREANTQSCAEASRLIREYASEVCAEMGSLLNIDNRPSE